VRGDRGLPGILSVHNTVLQGKYILFLIHIFLLGRPGSAQRCPLIPYPKELPAYN
jgi:hypothetical protein